MNRIAAAALATVIAGAPTVPAIDLASHALIMGPTGISDPSLGYIEHALNYMTPLGFDGDAVGFHLPNAVTNDSYVLGEAALVAEVQQQWDAGEFSADDPLWLFGYSQSATIIGDAESAWAAYGVDTDALHIVMVGDPASAHGGFIGNIADWILSLFGFPYLAQAVVTPDSLYATDVFTLPHDGWASFADNPNLLDFGHLAYLGIDPATIGETIDSGPTFIDGMTDYYSISIDPWAELMAMFNSWMEAVSA